MKASLEEHGVMCQISQHVDCRTARNISEDIDILLARELVAGAALAGMMPFSS